MALSPQNPNINFPDSQEFTSTIQNAVWSIVEGAGVLGAGSNSYKKLFTPVEIGFARIRARLSNILTVSSGLQKNDDDTITILNTDNNKAVRLTGTLNDIGDYFDFKISDVPAGFFYLYFGLDTVFTEYTYVNIGNSIFSEANGGSGAVSYVSGDTLRAILVSNGSGGKALKLIKNPDGSNTTIAVSTKDFVGGVQRIDLEIYNGYPVAAKIQPFFFSNAPYEETTINVFSSANTISPSNPTITFNATQQFTANFTGAKFSKQAGGGSITSSGLYTAPNAEGVTVIRGETEIWTDILGAPSEVTSRADNSLLRGAGGNYIYLESNIWLKNEGDFVEMKIFAGWDNYNTIALLDGDNGYAVNLTGNIVGNLDNNHIYRYNPSGGNYINEATNFSINVGDRFRYEIIAGGYLRVKKNGITLATFSVIPNYKDATKGYRFRLLLANEGTGRVIERPVFHSSTSDFKSALATITTAAAPPDSTPPTNVVLGDATINGSTTAALPFTPATDLESSIAEYLYEFDTTNTFDSGSKFQKIYAGITSPFNVTGLPVGTALYYRAKAKNGEGIYSSNWSNIKTLTTWNTAPTFTTDAGLDNINTNQSTDFTLATSGGDGTRTIALQSGQSFPSGVSLNGNVLTINRSSTGGISILLKVTDANGQSSNRTFTATLVDPNAVPPIANFTVPPSVQINQNFQLANTSIGATSYVWYKRVLNTGEYVQFSTQAGPTVSFSAIGTYQIKLKAINSYGETQIVKTLTASNLATIELCYKRPLKKEPILTQTIFESINGAEDVVEDEPLRYRYPLQVVWVGLAAGETLESFLENHRRREPFLWYNPEKNETKEVKMISYSSEEMLAYGGFEIVLEEV